MKNTHNRNISLSRRSFLIGSVNTSLMMAFAPFAFSADNQLASEYLRDKHFSPTVWFEIDSQGKVLVNIAKAEMGQHVGTALARIISDELGADWLDVTINHVDTDPKWGYMVTGGSWSVFTSYKPLSQAGAAGRVALIEAGAKLLGVAPSECETKSSQVFCGQKKISFADIVQKSDINRTFTAEELDTMPIKEAKQRTQIGKQSNALDIPAKVNGTTVYGIDVDIDGMVYARPVLPPTRYGCKVIGVDDSNAKAIDGYIGYEILDDPSETIQGWVSVIAKDYPSAIRAGDVITVTYNKGPNASVTEKQIQEEGTKLANNKEAGLLFIDEGDVEKAFSVADNKKLTADYYTSSVLHFQMEPVNAVAEFKDGLWHIHTGNQWQSLSLPITAKALGVADDKVIYHQYYLGGGFGRRLYGDYTIPAALTSKAIDRPVKMIFTRADDSRFDCIRSPSAQHFEAALDNAGQITGMYHSAVAGWPTKAMAPGFLFESLDKKGGIDPFSSSGANHWYSLPNHRVKVETNELAQATFLPGWLRAVGPGWIGWGVESFMDELAVAGKRDPIEFRLSMLDGKGKNAGKAPESVGGATRLANVLNTVKRRADWGRKLPDDEGLGVAVAAGQERSMPTWIACVAHVKVDRASGNVNIKKIHAVVDCGTTVHPDGALAQMEGSMLWGVSIALHEHTEISQGQVEGTNLHNYTPLRMADVPELDIQFIASEQPPTGLGEPGLIAVCPAIGNAIFNAVGVRLRSLPVKPEQIVEALAS